MTNKTFWSAFLTGLTAGAVVALLYAPNDGKTTRKKIGRAYDEAEDYVEDAGDYLKDQAERLTKEANYAYKQGVKTLDEAYAKATEALNEAYGEAKGKLVEVADLAVDQFEAAAKKGKSLI